MKPVASLRRFAGINSTKPHVVLLDVHMPDGGGVAVLRGIDSGPVCLALSVSDAAEDVIAVIAARARVCDQDDLGIRTGRGCTTRCRW